MLWSTDHACASGLQVFFTGVDPGSKVFEVRFKTKSCVVMGNRVTFCVLFPIKLLHIFLITSVPTLSIHQSMAFDSEGIAHPMTKGSVQYSRSEPSVP